MSIQIAFRKAFSIIVSIARFMDKAPFAAFLAGCIVGYCLNGIANVIGIIIPPIGDMVGGLAAAMCTIPALNIVRIIWFG